MSEREITTVMIFPNNMVAVCDQFGEQMPEYQGRYDDVAAKIDAVFSGEWDGDRPEVTPRDVKGRETG